MKKRITFAAVLVCIFGLAGCSSEKAFGIANASKIELCSGSDGTTVEITNEEDIQYITDNINDLKFSRGKSSKDHSGWSYRLKWYDSENNLIEELIVMSEYQIDYKDYFYTSIDTDHEIDISFLEDTLKGVL
ncbi:MAG: hypothetical protein K2O91_24850 [Lachnospiraceae bacterium]|nr:hypothetical protein [Lachnospiraceae bacterium]